MKTFTPLMYCSFVLVFFVSYLPQADGQTNTPPIALPDFFPTTEGLGWGLDVLANDSDAEENLVSNGTITVTVPATNGNVINITGGLLYLPYPNTCGEDTFVYQVCDSDGACASAVVTLAATCTFPQPVDDMFSTGINTPVVLDVVSNDSDPQDATLDPCNAGTGIHIQAGNGTVDYSNCIFTYTPNTDYCGTDYFQYQICDTDGNCKTAEVAVTVDGSESLAMADATINLIQIGNTSYTDGCSGLIAAVEQSGTNPVVGDVTAKVWFDATVSDTGQPYVQRHIEITPTDAATATGTVTLYFTQAEFDAFNAAPGSIDDLPTSDVDANGIANLRITKFPGVSGDGSGNPSSYTGTPVLIDPIDSNIVWNDAMSRWEVTFNVTGFSGFFAHTGSTPLPVELTYFQARKDGATSLLTWETASEENNRGFHIEQSTNERDFEAIGWIDGNGNTTEVQEYEFIHEKTNTGVNYYRLAQEDFDGTISYSDIRTVLFETDFDITIYPSPSRLKSNTNIQIISTNPQQVNVSVFELNGRQVMSMNHDINKGNNTLSLPQNLLSKGIYIISITHDGGTKNVKLSIVE